jgi:Zn-dependent protease with chaperone function
VSTHPHSHGAPRLSVDFFDGRSARAQRVSIWIDQDTLYVQGIDAEHHLPLHEVKWSEKTRHGPRLAHLNEGGTLQAVSKSEWDEWLHRHHLDRSVVVRLQQSWAWTLLAMAVLTALIGAGYLWGLPLVTRTLTPLIPLSTDQQIGQSTLSTLDGRWLHPSKVPQATQQRIQAQFEGALSHYAQQHQQVRSYRFQLHFRSSSVGPNAFALPGGDMVVTDELVTMLADSPDVLLGVLGHELGHVAARHGMRTLIQSGVLGAVTSVALGDVSSLLAGAPALMGQMAYSRDFEREADDTSIAFMQANGIRPSTMVTLFDKLAAYSQTRHKDKKRGTALLGIAFSSHPADAERVAHFKAADTSLLP